MAFGKLVAKALSATGQLTAISRALERRLRLPPRRRDEGIPTPDTEGLRLDVKQITKVLQLTSICGLGYVAPIPVSSEPSNLCPPP